jgi:phosphohistidine swiveling domain-containing protein
MEVKPEDMAVEVRKLQLTNEDALLVIVPDGTPAHAMQRVERMAGVLLARMGLTSEVLVCERSVELKAVQRAAGNGGKS